MAQTDIGAATTTTLRTSVKDFSITPMAIEQAGAKVPIYYDFPKFTKYYGNYMEIPEVHRCVNALTTWAVGKGYTADAETEVILDNIVGNGKQNFISISMGLLAIKLFNGDALAEIVWDDKEERNFPINLKMLDPSTMRVYFDESGMIEKYMQRIAQNEPREISKWNIFHLMNDPIANQIHGTSKLEPCQWIIDAKAEAMRDWRRISHRSTIRVMYIDMEDTTKLTTVKNQYADAIKNGEVLIIPAKKGEAELQDYTLPPVEGFLAWIRWLDSQFFAVFGVPKVIATSEDYTEAGGKVGFLSFEPNYSKESYQYEKEVWDQLHLRLLFNRPPSLMGNVQSDETKNTGQLGFQPNDVTIGSGEA